ncbi:MAG: hypothetical protein KY459_09155 [Acidobacteria bacterium]|nr:hypothetical protein [Acidobacteriota bacterium]
MRFIWLLGISVLFGIGVVSPIDIDVATDLFNGTTISTVERTADDVIDIPQGDD